METINVCLDKDAIMPTRAHDGDAGLDLYSRDSYALMAHTAATIDTGVHIQIPYGYEGHVRCRSGMNIKHGCVCFGTIDYGYTGSIRIKLYNLSDKHYFIQSGDRIAQLVISKCELQTPVLVDSLDETERGDGGFGSTGR